MGLVLKGATLIDGNGGDPLANAAVHIEGERIAWVGSADNLPAEAQAAEQIDVSGKWLLPRPGRRPHPHLLQRQRQRL